MRQRMKVVTQTPENRDSLPGCRNVSFLKATNAAEPLLKVQLVL